MTVVGISMVKDEIDILPYTIMHMLTQVDYLLLLDDGSTDGTLEYLNDCDTGSGIYLYHGQMREGYYQSDKMTALANDARDIFDADWVVPFDADEFWVSQWGTLKEVLENHTDSYGIVTAALFDHMRNGIDDKGYSPLDLMTWRRTTPLPLPKVACRTAHDLVIEQGNHGARYTIPARRTDEAPIVIHHYPYRSHEQFIRKVRNGGAAYAKTDLPEDMGRHWREWNKFSDEQLIELFDTYYFVKDPRHPYMLDGVEQPKLYKDPFHV